MSSHRQVKPPQHIICQRISPQLKHNRLRFILGNNLIHNVSVQIAIRVVIHSGFQWDIQRIKLTFSLSYRLKRPSPGKEVLAILVE